MTNIIDEVKQPLTPDEFEKELVRLANIMNSPITAGANITENSKQKDARAIYITRCDDTDRIHAAIDKSINKLSKEHNWLIARIEELEAERRWIPVEEWMSNSENEMVNVTTWHSNFEEEFPVAYFSNGAWMEWNNGGRPGDDLPRPEFVRPLPPPPEGSADRAQERGANDKA